MDKTIRKRHSCILRSLKNAIIIDLYLLTTSFFQDPEKRALVDRMMYFDVGTLYKSIVDYFVSCKILLRLC